MIAGYGVDHERYRRDLRAMTTDDWADELAGQAVEVSHIAGRKHRMIGRASRWMAASLALWAAAVACVTLTR